MSVTLYTKNPCVACDATKRMLKKNGITEWEEVSLDDPANAETLETFKQAGHLQAPIVEAGGETWSGFRMDKIKEFAKARNAAVVAW